MAACKGRSKGRWTSKPSFEQFIKNMDRAFDGLLGELCSLYFEIRNMQEFMSEIEAKNYDPQYLRTAEARPIRDGLRLQRLVLLKNRDILEEIQKFLEKFQRDLTAREMEINDKAEHKEKGVHKSTETIPHDGIAIGTASAGHPYAGKDDSGGRIASAVHSNAVEDSGKIASTVRSDAVVLKGGGVVSSDSEEDLEAKQRYLNEIRMQLKRVQNIRDKTWMRNEILLQRLNTFLMEKGLNLNAKESDSGGESSDLQQDEVKTEDEESIYETAEEKSDDEITRK